MIPHTTAGEVWRGRHVLVTGHTGFKGRWLVEWLRQLGAVVTGFSIDEGARHAQLDDPLPDIAANITGDVRDLTAVQRAVDAAAAEIVFHLAAQPIVSLGYSDPVGTYATNVMGTVCVLEAVRAARSRVQAVVVVTSDKCYDNKEWVWAYRESDRLGGFDPYSNSKACAELVTDAYRRSFFGAPDATLIASGRAGNVIGPGDWSPNRLVPDLVRGLASGTPAEIRQPRSIRPWQHVLEPVAGYMTVATRLLQDDRRIADAWNFGPFHQDEQPVARIADTLCEAWGRPGHWKNLGRSNGPHEAGVLKIDSRKAHSVLGWTPKLGLDRAIEWSAQGYRSLFEGTPLAVVMTTQLDRYLANRD